MARRPADEYEPPIRVGRQEFLEEIWDPSDGEHVTFIAPTQNGKTTMIGDLLAHLPAQKNPPVMLVMKPRDPVVDKIRKRLHYRKIRSWPPPVLSRYAARPPGYVLWPRHTFDPDRDDALLRQEMRKAILGSYKDGDRVVVADETYGLVNELGLQREMTAVHTRGAGMGVSLWCAAQGPKFVGTWLYSQAEYLFIGYDPDERARDRFEEIGGFQPGVISQESAKLQKFEWLFLQRTGRKMCIIGAS